MRELFVGTEKFSLLLPKFALTANSPQMVSVLPMPVGLDSLLYLPLTRKADTEINRIGACRWIREKAEQILPLLTGKMKLTQRDPGKYNIHSPRQVCLFQAPYKPTFKSTFHQCSFLGYLLAQSF